jgi:hypothetical protein
MDGLNDVIESTGLLKTVEKFAPILASTLGGPLAGIVVSLLANIFHVDAKNIPSLNDAIASDSEAGIKLKKLEYDHFETLTKIASTDYSTEVSDKMDARKWAALYKNFIRHMAYVVTFGFFGTLLIMFMPIPFNHNERELLSMLVGVLGSKWQTIIDFFYGSSHKFKIDQ